MKENSDGNDTNVGSIGNSIEEDIKIVEKLINTMKSDRELFNEKTDKEIYTFFINALEHILSDYKRVLKENEKLRVKWNKDTHILQNKLDYANADRIDLAQQNKELRKENEELNNRCRNLDKEAQAYLEELAGDNTLTRRTIKQLQEENEELKIKNNAIKRESEAYAEHMIRLDNELNLEKEKSKYEWIRQNCLSQELVNKLYIPIQKVKDKIEKYKNMCISSVSGYENYFKDNYNELVFRRIEQLEKELLGEFIDEPNEKYQFTWNEENQALKLSQTPPPEPQLPTKTICESFSKKVRNK